jgi:regulator of protease activity HflC (stomatin/prohibitin superfamily)
MLDWIGDLVKQVFIATRLFTIVPAWELGLRVRGGKGLRSLEPGLHWLIPFWDVVEAIPVKLQIVNLPNQSLRTLDDKTVAVSAAVAYTVVDVKLLFTEVHNYDDSLVNLTMGHLADWIANRTWPECGLDKMQKEVSIVVRREAKKWGIAIDHVYITDLCLHKALRLLTETTYKNIGSQ